MNARAHPIVVVALMALAVPGCKRKGDERARESVDSGAAAAPAGAASRNEKAAAPRADAGLAVEIYRGKVGNSAVVMRLHEQATTLGGQYYYESQGGSLALDGARAPDGRYALQESVDGKVTGHLSLSKVGGGLRGEWESASSKSKPLPVVLDSVPRPSVAETAIVTFRHWRAKIKPTADQIEGRRRVNAKDAPNAPCVAHIAYPQLIGLASSHVEDSINERLLLTASRNFDWPEACSMGSKHESTFVVLTNRQRLFSYCQDVGFDFEKAPTADWYPRVCATYDLNDGHEVRAADIIAEPTKKALTLAVKDASRAIVLEAGESEAELDGVVEELLAGPLVLGSCGVFLQRDTSGGRSDWYRRLYDLSFERIRSLIDASSPVAVVAKGASSPCVDPFLAKKGPARVTDAGR